jgi:hypothetical protein
MLGQTLDTWRTTVNRTPLRLSLASASLGLAIAGVLVVPGPAQAAPDTACMKAGIKTLQGRDLLDDVARDGISLATAGSLGVAPRDPDLDLTAVPDPIPLPLLLADHRAGDQSLFVYPWC